MEINDTAASYRSYEEKKIDSFRLVVVVFVLGLVFWERYCFGISLSTGGTIVDGELSVALIRKTVITFGFRTGCDESHIASCDQFTFERESQGAILNSYIAFLIGIRNQDRTKQNNGERAHCGCAARAKMKMDSKSDGANSATTVFKSTIEMTQNKYNVRTYVNYHTRQNLICVFDRCESY